MRQVSKEEFFAEIGQRDVVLNCEPDQIVWETRQRLPVGRTTPGWRGGGQKTYWINEMA